MMLPSVSSLLMTPPDRELLHSFQSFEDVSHKMDQHKPQEPHVVGSSPLPMELESRRTKHTRPMLSEKKNIMAGQQPSPPVSPEELLAQRRDSSRTLPPSNLATEVDPVLFPTNDQGSKTALSGEPLFSQSQDDLDKAIQAHISKRSVHYMKGKSRGDTRNFRYQMPSHSEYLLAVSFVSTLMADSNTLKRQREEDKENYPNAKRLGVQRSPSAILPEVAPTGTGPTRQQPPKATSAAVPAKKAPKRKANAQSPQQAQAKKSPAARKAIPRAAPGASGRSGQNTSGHTRNREPKKPIDINWRAIKDYSPPLEILDRVLKPLKVEWDGTPQKMDNLPDLEFLHPAEVDLASTLRLDPARYLTCKRRIFERRLECLKTNKDFKRTDAQQSCQVDVNKASRMWAAYDGVGWFDAAHFKQYL